MASQPRVFISYHRSDEMFARQIREQLTSHGVGTWMDQYDIPVGAYWPDEIDKGLASSATVVGILSPESVESRNVKNEWDWAMQNGKPLLLVRIGPCIIPHRYVSINFIDATGGDASRVTSSLLTALGLSARIAPMTSPDDVSPTPIRPINRRASPRLTKPLVVGRNAELTLLRQTLDELLNGHGSLVLVSGEAGIGKTTLTSWLLAEAEERGLLPLSGGCYDLTTTPPYGPWAEMLAGFPEDDELPPLPAQLRAGGGLAGIDSQAALFELTLRFLTSVAEARLLVLLLEDVHWADPASLDFLRFASRALQRVPILLLATYRDDEITREHPLSTLLPALVREGHVQRLHLGRLDRAALLELVRERYLLPANDEERLIAYLLHLAEGNPFFTKELLHSLEEQRLLAPSAGAWGLRELADSSVPSLIHQITDGRLARLDTTTRTLLDHASVVGFDAPLDLLQALYGDASRELDDALQQAVQHHVLTINHSRGIAHFSHALVRQAIYQAIPPLRRQELHRSIGELLAERPRTDRSVVANHFFEARDERALDWLVRSARAAQRLFAPETVIAECNRAIALSDTLGRDVSPSAYRLSGLARDLTGDFDGALSDLSEALALARNAANVREEWQTLLDLAELWAARDYQRTGDYCRQIVEIARTMDDPAALGHSLNRLANWHANAEQPSEGIRYHDEARRIFEAIGDRHGLASTLDLFGTTYSLIGDATQAMRHYERAIPLLRQLDERRILSSALANAAQYSRGSWLTSALGVQELPASLGADAREPADEAIRLAREIGWRAGEAYAVDQAGFTMARRGNLRAGYASFNDALAIAESIQHRQWLAIQHINFGSISLDLRLLQRAAHHLEQALAHATATGSAAFHAGATGLLATTLILSGEDDAAERLLHSRADLDHGLRFFSEGACWYAHALLLLNRNQPESALDIVDRVIAWIPIGDADLPPEWLRFRGEILQACGRPEDAERSLDHALAVASRHELRLIHWRTLASLQRLYLSTGRAAEASIAQDAALALVNDLAAQMDDPELHEAFLTNAHRELDHRPSDASRSTAPNHAGLTAREFEILRYLADGRSDREIADALSVSPRTVGNHVSNILAKLGVSSRTAAATFAIREGLVSS